MKVVHLPRPGLAVSNLPINPQEEHWKDRFDVSVEGEQLTVNRVDGGTGWRQPLRLRAWVAGSDAAFEPIAQSPRIVARSEGKVRPPQSLHPDHDNAPTRPWTQEPEPDQVLGEGGPLLHSGVYGVPQTWSQEPHGYQRRVHVHVASELSDQPRPVLLLLHGRGGNGRLAVRSAVLQQLPDATSKYIVIGLSGYRNCWNVCGEESKAPDLEFVELVVKQLCTYANVDPTFILYGTSNGSGLLNNVLIQSSDKRIVAAISEVSQLNSQQYRDKSFWKQDSQGAYTVPVKTPIAQRRLLLMSGALDPIVPFHGGPTRLRTADGGVLEFLPALESAQVWTSAMNGRDQVARAQPETSAVGRPEHGPYGDVVRTSFLDGAVVHLRFDGMRHNLNHPYKQEAIMEFLE